MSHYTLITLLLSLPGIILLLCTGGFFANIDGANIIDGQQQQQQQQDSEPTNTTTIDLEGELGHPERLGIDDLRFNFSDGAQLMQYCHIGPEMQVNDLSDECEIIKSFNQTALDLMEHNDLIDLVSACACQLANMYQLWVEYFDDTPITRRVAAMVQGIISKQINNNAAVNSNSMQQQQQQGKGSKTIPAKPTSPSYLWTDIDVTIYQISIYTATSDYFYQQVHNKSMAIPTKLRTQLERDQIWKLIWEVCRKIVRDPYNLYRYMENINRASAPIFFNILQISDNMATVYAASKACKLPLMLHLQNYKLKATQSHDRLLNPSASSLGYHSGTRDDFGGPSDGQSTTIIDGGSSSSSNLINDEEAQTTNDIDLMLNGGASTLLLKCAKWRKDASAAIRAASAATPSPRPATINATQELARDCPMMVSENGPTEWIKLHSASSPQRSMAAIKCGCQLIGHNATWSRMMRDQNVQVMSKALTNYMNRNQVPDFVNTPIWSIFGWFELIMGRFINNRKTTIKEVVKTLSGDQDPLEMKSRADSELALELCRRACNFIVFNYNKGSRENPNRIELNSIKFLDNLRIISQDPMFVFHLTLQDANLFKLHALSKMCLPFVS